MRVKTRQNAPRVSHPAPVGRRTPRRWLGRAGRGALRFARSIPLRVARRVRAIPQALVSVRVRLALWYLAILAIVFLVFGGIVYSTTVRNAQNEQSAALATTSQQLIQNYDAATGMLNVSDPFSSGLVAPGGKATRPVDKGSLFVLGPSDIAVLFNTQDQVAQRLGPVSDQGVADLQDIVRLRHAKFGSSSDTSLFYAKVATIDTSGRERFESLVVYLTSFSVNGQPAGTLVVGQPPLANATLQSLVPGLLIAGPLTLLVAALGGYWVASRAMRPVRLITRAAQAIGEKDLSRRLLLKRRDELGDLAATFDHMLDRLEAAFTRQRQFTADASHELRTPLTVVDLEVSRGLTTRQPPEEYERILAAVRAENAHMSRLVEDLLMLARADTDQAQLRPEPLDLSDVALDALERLAPLARERRVELVAGALPELRVVADRAALTRLFVNLIENGVKYTTGAHARVTLTTGGDDTHGASWAWARVADNGPGIPDEHLPHIFERFYRVDAARQRGDIVTDTADGASGGSGLGLAIARWIAEAHGGFISVSSAPGEGSVFEARLPLVAG
ncbi:MAG TPA: HAMP domain-containing sensor histidine kinase [Ktedonobacterales bacterium]|nr:HAMP domain-containing sensor histidine kinase [Ktedonobacterales bacterium]